MASLAVMEELMIDSGVARMATEAEEEAAEPTAGQLLKPALCMVNKGPFSGGAPPLPTDVLLISCNSPGHAILEQAVPGGHVQAAIALPGMRARRQRVDGKAAGESAFVMSPAGAQPAVQEPHAALVLPCRMQCAPESAVLLARALRATVDAALTVVLDTLPAHRYLGPLDPSQGTVVHCVASGSAARLLPEQAEAWPVPPLPCGCLLDGLPAAIVSAAEGRNKAAIALVLVQSLPTVSASSLLHLGRCVDEVLRACGKAEGAVALAVSSAAPLAAASWSAGDRGRSIYA